MSRLFTSKRIVVAGIATAVVLGRASAAFAYFTASGSGTGSATTGSTGNWSVTQASATGNVPRLRFQRDHVQRQDPAPATSSTQPRLLR